MPFTVPSLLGNVSPAAERTIVFLAFGGFIGIAIATILVTPREPMMASEPTPEQEELLSAINDGDVAWILTSCALVLLMTPGVGFFYGGAVRHKNVVNTIMMSYVTLGLVAVFWVVVGFSFSFAPNWFADGTNGLVGNPATYGLFRDVGAVPNPDYAGTIPFTLYAMFQMVFAVITPALITGAIAERARFTSLLLFFIFWMVLVYCPMAHMVWSPWGIIRNYGVVDYAGGTVVHMTSGYAALTASIYLGKRKDLVEHHESANVPYIMLGTAMLWFGWFGFNAGSAVVANQYAAQAWMTTNTSAACAMMAWLLLDHLRTGKSKASGACAGAVVGLVSITPACGFVSVGGAMCIGIIGAVVCHTVQWYFVRFGKIDDTVDVFPCHGVGGTVGMVLTSMFADPLINGIDGLFYGGVEHFWHTLVVLVIIVPYIMLATFVCLIATDLITPLRVPLEDEIMGMDYSMHGENAAALDHVMDIVVNKINESVHGGSAYGNGDAKHDSEK